MFTEILNSIFNNKINLFSIRNLLIIIAIYAIPLILIFGTLLTSDHIAAMFGLEHLIQKYRNLLLIVNSSLCISFLMMIWSVIVWRIYQRLLIAFGEKYLHALTAEEQKLLQPYILTGAQIGSLNPNNGSVNALTRNSIIYKAADFPLDPLKTTFIDYCIHTWAFDCLVENPHLIGLTNKDILSINAMDESPSV